MRNVASSCLPLYEEPVPVVTLFSVSFINSCCCCCCCCLFHPRWVVYDWLYWMFSIDSGLVGIDGRYGWSLMMKPVSVAFFKNIILFPRWGPTNDRFFYIGFFVIILIFYIHSSISKTWNLPKKVFAPVLFAQSIATYQNNNEILPIASFLRRNCGFRTAFNPRSPGCRSSCKFIHVYFCDYYY